jgi:hypothetical protein
VSPAWKSKLARLSHMSWDEIRTRGGQEFYKRSELARYRLGQPQTLPAIAPTARPRPHFFFPAGAAQERANLLRAHLPAVALEILHRADDIRRHHFDLLGYEDLDYGTEIDWHSDRVHGKRAPRDPWFTIPFLDFSVVGDHKITWELNRHQYFVTLAKAWLLSHDEKYIRELVTQWKSWVGANPYPLGINWGSSLEAAFRSLSWIWSDHLLEGAPGLAEFRVELLPSLALHGRYIERYLSTYFSPNTHLIGEAAALFFIGTLYPEIARAARWREKGWNILLQETRRQVRPDGVYFEQSLHYHVYALDFFLHARALAAMQGIPVPAEYDAALNKMLAVVEALSQAGPPEGFGDDDGGRLFDPRRNRTEHMVDPLATGTLIYGRNDLLAARLTEESIWMFGQSAIDALDSRNSRAVPTSAAFRDGGIYVFGDSQPAANQIVVDAGPQGIGRSGHGHADALSLRLGMNGRRWLVDGGSGVYIAADPADRNVLRRTAAHNTLRVDGLDQAEIDGPFSWTVLPETRLDNWTSGKSFTYFAGSHNGYARLADPVTHSRCVVKINGGPMLVRDVALGSQEHDLEVRWHFANDLEATNVRDHYITVSIAEEGAREEFLDLIMPEQSIWQMEVTRTLISPVYGKFEKAPLLRAHARVRLPAEVATLLSLRTTRPESNSRFVSLPQKAVHTYRWVEGDSRHEFCFALDKRPWDCGPWFSDAEFFYQRIEGESLAHLVVVGGTYLAWQGREVLRAAAPSEFFEWRKADGLLHSEPNRFSVSPLFYEFTGGAILPADSSLISSTYAEKP